MRANTDRRSFLQSAGTTGALAALGDFAFLRRLPRVSAAEARLDSRIVRLDPEIEPLVQLLEKTPRNQLLEKVAERVRRGTSYREVLAALLLAGVRNVEPRPSVGFKFHAVLVVNSAHLASLSSPAYDRWLPIFWAIDYFKASQARDVKEKPGDWAMAPVDEPRVPSAAKARSRFIDAMRRWDPEAADVSVAGLARTAGANEIFELLWRFGSRDFRSIGHKAIFVANSYRALQCIGWQHAEPVLRSLTYALLNHNGEPNPADSDLSADHAWRRNQQLARGITDTWLEGRIDPEATLELLDVLRTASPDEVCDKVAQQLNAGISPQSVWDAVFDGSGELLMRQPGIVALHALTTANALRFAYQTSGNDVTRRLVLLQNAAFVAHFRDAARGRGELTGTRIEKIGPQQLTSTGEGAIEEIFAGVGHKDHARRLESARKVLAYLEQNENPKPLIDAARRLTYVKGNDAHDYKFSSAVLEDYHHVSPAWRSKFIAASTFWLKGATNNDSGLVARTRAALEA